MKKRQNRFAHVSALQTSLLFSLLSFFAIVLVIAAPGNAKNRFPEHTQLRDRADSTTAQANYPNVSVSLSGNTTVTPDATPITPTPTPPPSPSPGCGVLYDQLNNLAAFSTNSQDFEVSFDAYDDELADDFVVPGGETWTITQMVAAGVYSNGFGPAASFNVRFYINSGGFPGGLITARFNAAYVNNAGNFVITLPSPVVLGSGTYWVSIQARMDLSAGGNWGWTDRTVQSNSPAAWQNPGGGFAMGCTTWGVRNSTCGMDPGAPDQAFQVIGCMGGTPGPTATATFTPTTATPRPTATATFTPTGFPTATATGS